MERQLRGFAAERPLGATTAQPHKRVPEYVRLDTRTKVFGLLSAHVAALLALAKLTVFLSPPAEPAESVGAGTTTAATVKHAESPGSRDDPNEWRVAAGALVVVMLVLAAGVLVAAFDIFGLGRKTQRAMCNVALAVALLQGQDDFQLRTLLPELLFVLSATLILTTGINFALSARLRALSGDLMGDFAVQGRWTGRGVVLAGVTVAGPAPSTLPSLPLLLAWLAAAWLGSACVGAHSNVAMNSFTVLWLFLIDADGPLQQGDPDDHLRIVLLMHSKVALLLGTAALEQLCVAVAGPGLALHCLRGLLGHLVTQDVHPAVRKAVLHSWPGPPPAERLEAARLLRELARQRLEAEQLVRLRRWLEAQQLMLEMARLSRENDRERLREISPRLQQILQEMSPARHRAAAAAEGEELPV